MGAEYFLNVGLGIIGFFCAFILYELNGSIKKATKEITDLNLKMEKFIQKSEQHEKEIYRVDKRVEKLEEKITITKDRLHSLGNTINELQIIKEKIKWVNPDKH